MLLAAPGSHRSDPDNSKKPTGIGTAPTRTRRVSPARRASPRPQPRPCNFGCNFHWKFLPDFLPALTDTSFGS